MPPGHGKTTFHNPSAGWIDAGSIIRDKSKLRDMRRQARESGDWNMFDDYWVKLIEATMPIGTLLLMCPSMHIANRFSYFKVATLILKKDYFDSVIEGRPKSSLEFARESYLNSINEASELIIAENHDCIRENLMGMVRGCSKEHCIEMMIIHTAKLPKELVIKICLSNLRLLTSAYIAGLIDGVTFQIGCNRTEWRDFSDYWATLRLLNRGPGPKLLDKLIKGTVQDQYENYEKVLDQTVCWSHQGWNNYVEYKLARCGILLSEDAKDSMDLSTCYNKYSRYDHSEIFCNVIGCKRLNSFGQRMRDSNSGLMSYPVMYRNMNSINLVNV